MFLYLVFLSTQTTFDESSTVVTVVRCHMLRRFVSIRRFKLCLIYFTFCNFIIVLFS